MTRRRSHAADPGHSGNDGLPDMHSNKGLSLREIADTIMRASAPPAANLRTGEPRHQLRADKGPDFMPIYNLQVASVELDQVEFRCPDCCAVAKAAYGAHNKDQLAYLLVCPSCAGILGEWMTPEEKNRELKELAKKAKSSP